MKYISTYKSTFAYENAKYTGEIPHLSFDEYRLKTHGLYTDPMNGITNYVDIGGVRWATKNLGANTVTDLGLYYQWGDLIGHAGNTIGDEQGQYSLDPNNYCFIDEVDISNNYISYSKYSYNNGDNLQTLERVDDAANNTLGGEWRIPSINDWQALYNNATYEVIRNYQSSGVNVVLFTDKKDQTKQLIIPLTGLYEYKSEDDGLTFQTTFDDRQSAYWSNDLLVKRYSSSEIENDIYYTYVQIPYFVPNYDENDSSNDTVSYSSIYETRFSALPIRPVIK